MAGEWIKVRTNLWDDPRITQLCDLTGSAEATVIGGLYWLWATADEHTENGHMPGLSIAAIDRKTGVKGLGQALLTVGWIDDTDGGITINRFDEHNGTSAKNRASTAKRVANHAARTKAELKANADVTTQNEATNALTVSTPLAREEKIRIEETEPPKPPVGGLTVVAKPEGKTKTRGTALKTFLADCEEKGIRPMRDYEPLWKYTETAKLPRDFVILAWVEFCRRFGSGGVKEANVQKDWRKTFRNYVENNYLKLWAVGPDGEYFLTTQGKQAQTVAEAA